MANGYSATGYGLAIRDEENKSSMGYEIGTLRILNVYRFMLKLSPLFIYAMKNHVGG